MFSLASLHLFRIYLWVTCNLHETLGNWFFADIFWHLNKFIVKLWKHLNKWLFTFNINLTYIYGTCLFNKYSFYINVKNHPVNMLHPFTSHLNCSMWLKCFLHVGIISLLRKRPGVIEKKYCLWWHCRSCYNEVIPL